MRLGFVIGSEEPDRIPKQVGISVLGTEYFFAGHRVSRKKTRLALLTVQHAGTINHGLFDTADIGHELMRLQDGREALDPFENGKNRASQEDDVGDLGCLQRIFCDDRDGSAFKSESQLSMIFIPAKDIAREAMLAQGETHRAADESCSEYCDSAYRLRVSWHGG